MQDVFEFSGAAGGMLVDRSDTLVPTLRSYLKQHSSHLESTDRNRGLVVGQERCKVYDGIVGALFDASRALTGNKQPLALGAVGSYGREMPSPQSDLDVRLLCESDVDSAAPVAEALLYPLWDAGLDIGHQVVTTSDLIQLAHTDLTTATALLDWRTVAGDKPLGKALETAAYERVFCHDRLGNFVDRLEAYNRSRYERYGDSVYLLEPNIKNGAGGLRDLDIVQWCTRAGFRTGNLSDLIKHDVLLPTEWEQLERARDHLLTMRNALHTSVGRKADRLTFDLQEELARTLGYGENSTAVEALMSDYYKHARRIRHTCGRLLHRIRPAHRIKAAPKTLGEGFIQRGDTLHLANETLFDEQPRLCLRAYELAIQHELRVAEPVRRVIALSTAQPEFCARLRQDRTAARSFCKLVTTVRTTRFRGHSVLSELHEVGLLLAMIPEFAPVVGRVHHDTYHVFTVDEHSVAAVDHLRYLARGEGAQDHPLASRLAAEHTRRHVLFFATLLHDVGKVLGRAGHAERGAEMAATILGRLGFNQDDIADAQLLIRLHLRMYQLAAQRDIEDPATVAAFCDDIGVQELLRELYLLTVADITTTSPTSMTRWKRRMLDELHLNADRYLAAKGELGLPTRIEQVRARVRDLCEDPEVENFLGQFLSGLPERYFFANEPETVVEHARFAASARGHHCSVQTRGEAPHVEVWVVADDRPGLLALIAASFGKVKLEILSAQVYSWVGQEGQKRSLDTFWVRHRCDDPITDEQLAAFDKRLRELLSSESEWTAALAPPSRRTIPPLLDLETRINIDNRSSLTNTVVEVITRDRPNLLFSLSRKLQDMGLSIEFAKLNTEGLRVADVFYVSESGGVKVTDPARLGDLERELKATVDRL